MSSPLRRLRDGLSLAQIIIALAAVALAGGVSSPSLVLFVALVSVAWWRPLPEAASAGSQRAWTALVFVALVATLVRAIARAEFLDAGVDFLLLLAVQRLFNRQRAREHAQLLLLGTLLLVVGAVINTEPSYPLLLAAYLVVATMALLVNTLVAEGERLGPRVMLRLGQEGHRRRRDLWRAATGVAVLAGVGALLTFVLFPRFGVGFFLRGGLPGETRSGFSDEVQLGDFGLIKTDATVVMRIRPEHDPNTPRTTWHLRGSAFDRYADGRWSHGPDVPSTPLRAAYGYRAVADDGHSRLQRTGSQLHGSPVLGFERSGELSRATVLAEDIGADVLFVPSDPVAVRVLARGALESRARPVGGRNQEVRVSKAPGPVQYRAVWRTAEPTREELLAVGDPTPSPELDPFLQRSEGLGPDVGALAQRLTSDASSRLAKVDAIMGYLRSFEYTLQERVSPRVEAGADPIEGFLLDTRAGHCEYFATGMAVMLREVGVPTRIVNGYYGAHRNEVGDFYTVRQADAHSWVEVHFGRLGWVTFDPTPPAGRTAGDDAPWWPMGAELLDALRNTYLEYVIDYDLGKQLAALERLGLRGGDRGPPGYGRWALLGVVLGAGAWVLRRRWRRRARVRPETRLLHELLRRLAAAGIEVEPSDGPRAIARRLRERQHPAAAEVERFLERYDALRFGPAPAPDALERLRADASAARHALRSSGRNTATRSARGSAPPG